MEKILPTNYSLKYILSVKSEALQANHDNATLEAYRHFTSTLTGAEVSTYLIAPRNVIQSVPLAEAKHVAIGAVDTMYYERYERVHFMEGTPRVADVKKLAEGGKTILVGCGESRVSLRKKYKTVNDSPIINALTHERMGALNIIYSALVPAVYNLPMPLRQKLINDSRVSSNHFYIIGYKLSAYELERVSYKACAEYGKIDFEAINARLEGFLSSLD